MLSYRIIISGTKVVSAIPLLNTSVNLTQKKVAYSNNGISAEIAL